MSVDVRQLTYLKNDEQRRVDWSYTCRRVGEHSCNGDRWISEASRRREPRSCRINHAKNNRILAFSLARKGGVQLQLLLLFDNNLKYVHELIWKGFVIPHWYKRYRYTWVAEVSGNVKSEKQKDTWARGLSERSIKILRSILSWREFIDASCSTNVTLFWIFRVTYWPKCQNTKKSSIPNDVYWFTSVTILRHLNRFRESLVKPIARELTDFALRPLLHKDSRALTCENEEANGLWNALGRVLVVCDDDGHQSERCNELAKPFSDTGSFLEKKQRQCRKQCFGLLATS